MLLSTEAEQGQFSAEQFSADQGQFSAAEHAGPGFG